MTYGRDDDRRIDRSAARRTRAGRLTLAAAGLALAATAPACVDMSAQGAGMSSAEPTASLADPMHARIPGFAENDSFGGSLSQSLSIEPFLDEIIVGGDYNDELARAYKERADLFYGHSQAAIALPHRTTFAYVFRDRSEAAKAGRLAEPFDAAAIGVTSPAVLASWRATRVAVRLFADQTPAFCAQTVASFDGWLIAHSMGAAGAVAVETLQPRWLEHFERCVGDSAIAGFPPGACENTDNDARLPDAPGAGRNERARIAELAAVIGDLRETGAVSTGGGEIVVTGLHTPSESRNVGTCRANFAVRALRNAGLRATAKGAAEESAEESGEGAGDYFSRGVEVAFE